MPSDEERLDMAALDAITDKVLKYKPKSGGRSGRGRSRVHQRKKGQRRGAIHLPPAGRRVPRSDQDAP